MAKNKKKTQRDYTINELYNPVIDLTRDALAYGRQSTKDQVVKNVQSHISQTILLLEYTKKDLGFQEDGTTGKVTLFVENQVIDADGNMSIKNASGTWPIDKRPQLKTICDLIEHGTPEGTRIGVVVAEFVDRLFRDEDRIDSNIFIKICKENDCYVHISSKRMTYNFANPAHAELFRMEVQMAAAYIHYHVKGTMLRRRDQVLRNGLWVGVGWIPVGFIVDYTEGSPTYGKFIPYEPHQTVQRHLYIRIIELGFNIDLLYRELKKLPYVFPEFEPWVAKEVIARFGLHKAPGGVGYTISKTGLEYMFCNVTNIGIFKRDGILIYDNHPATIEKDLFWMVYDHFKDTRPDGTPTNRSKLVRFTQHRTPENIRKPLLKPVAAQAHQRVSFCKGRYTLKTRGHYTHDNANALSVLAHQLEDVVVERLFQHIQDVNIGDIQEARTHREQEREKRLRSIDREIETINEEIATLTDNLTKLRIASVIEEVEQKMNAHIERRTRLVAEKAMIAEADDRELRTLEEELQELEALWPHKPFALKKRILDTLIKRIVLSYCSPRFFQITITWNLKEWGTEHCYYDKEHCGGQPWTNEEREILKEHYRATERWTLMQLLPARSWKAIYHEATNLKLSRSYHRSNWEDIHMTFRDIQFLEKTNLRILDFNLGNHTKFSCLVSAVSHSADVKALAATLRILKKQEIQKPSTDSTLVSEIG